jgi:hypothetical protein
MARYRFKVLWLALALVACWSFSACGKSTKHGAPLYPGKINLVPATNTSMTLGTTLTFTASVQTTSSTTLNTPVTYTSSDTSILNLAPGGVACAGQWDAAFTTCTPGNVGVVLVTASALGGSSIPTYVFVHPPVDNITVTGVLLTGVPVQEPCLSQSQTMTLQAHAYSQGTDVTSSVGPFTWSANNPAVATLTPLVNSYYNFPTDQVTATALNPGITYIYASASGVTSTSFQQPQYNNAQGTLSPIVDFFATCPIQNIALELENVGSGQTSLLTEKGSSSAQTVFATIVDAMGNSSLANTDGGVVLNKIPLTWSASRPGAISTASGCTESCALTISSPGAGTVTASCSPPSCNIGFPFNAATLFPPTSTATTAQQIATCTSFFQAQYPQFAGCQDLIPVPVYSSPVFVAPGSTTTTLSPEAAISAVVTGSPAAASFLATSTGCANQPPSVCITGVYYPTTAKASAGNEDGLPAPLNSLMFDPPGDKAFAGSTFGAFFITPGNFSSSTNAFTALGTVTGQVLATSINGTVAAFADNVHTPNQVYIVNTASSNSLSYFPLNISGATAATFSPDGLKTFILSGTSLYVYSPLQALQGPITLAGTGNAVAFSPNGAFAYVAQSAANGGSPTLTAFATCSNQAVASITLPANPILMKVLPNVHLDGQDSYGNTIPDGVHVLIVDSSGIDVITSTISQPATGTLCPQGLTFVSNDPNRMVQRIQLNVGTIQPVNFFSSADGTQLYVLSSSSSTIIVYSFISGSVVGGIELLNNATPVDADITVDGGTILVAGSDGLVHEVSTATGGSDLFQLTFPNLPDYFNPFCSYTPTAGPCVLTTVAAKP